MDHARGVCVVEREQQLLCEAFRNLHWHDGWIPFGREPEERLAHEIEHEAHVPTIWTSYLEVVAKLRHKGEARMRRVGSAEVLKDGQFKGLL